MHDLQMESFSMIYEMIQKPSRNFDEELKKIIMVRDFNIIQITNTMLDTMADLKEESKGLGNLKIFKNVSKKFIMVCILPLIASLMEEETQLSVTQICQKKQVLVKWWGTYIGIL